MSGFITKKITAISTLGEKLQTHRESRGLSIEEAAHRMAINVKYLKQLESDDYENLPPDVYSVNILKNYAELLNLNPIMVAEIYQKEKAIYLGTRKKKKSEKQTLWHKTINIFLNPQILKYFLATLAVAGIIAYIGWQMSKIISPPILIVDSPPDNLVIKDNQIEIRGVTEKEVNLTVNNRPVLSDRTGGFSLTVDLQNGLNVIKIAAKKKHSKEQVVYRRVVVEE